MTPVYDIARARLGRPLLTVALFTAALFSLALPAAHADGWVFDHYDVTSSDTGTYWQTGDTVTGTSGSYTDAYFIDAFLSDPYDNYPDIVFTSVSLSDTITPVFRWNGTGTPTTPARARISVVAGSDADSPDPNAAQADDGFGSDQGNYGPHWTFWPDGQPYGQASGSHLVSTQNIDTSGSAPMARFDPITMSASGTSITDRTCGVNCELDMEAMPDDRGAHIVRSGDPTSYKAPALDSNNNPIVDAWGNTVYAPTPHILGDGTGDTGLTETSNYSTSEVDYVVIYDGNFNNTDALPQWASSLTGAGSSAFDVNPDFTVFYDNPCPPVYIGTDPDGNPIYDPAQNGETGTDKITAQVSDSDGATVNAKYTMTVHNPAENPFQYRPQVKQFEPVSVTSSSPALYGANTQFTFTEPGADTSGALLANQALAALIAGSPSYIQAILALGGITANSLVPASVTYTTDFVTSWNTSGSTWDGSTTQPDASMMSNYKMTPAPKMRFVYTYVRADQYGPSGFAGQQDQTFHTLDTMPTGFECPSTFTLNSP